MKESTALQIEALESQTYGIEIEGNNITREKAARTAAEFFGTNRYSDTHRRNGYESWSAWDSEGREWKFHYSRNVIIRRKIPKPLRFRDFRLIYWIFYNFWV